jgi:cation:H+ antiporter
MIINTLFLLIGLISLLKGADLLVEGSKNLSLKFGVRPLIVALTVVAFGTSAPELFVSLVSAAKGSPEMAVGNVVGSNIANIALVLGVAGILKPVHVQKESLKFDFPLMIFVSILLFIFSLDGEISRLNGFFLLLIFFSYIIFCIFTSQNTESKSMEKPSKSKLFYLTKTVIGTAAIILGANLLVKGGLFWAREFNISEIVIGLTLFAVGTSLPELATSTVAILKNESDISLGNIIGSNIQNISLILAAIAVLSPLKIPAISIKTDFPIMIIYSLFIFLVLLVRKKFGRINGILILISYFFYVYYLYNRG